MSTIKNVIVAGVGDLALEMGVTNCAKYSKYLGSWKSWSWSDPMPPFVRLQCIDSHSGLLENVPIRHQSHSNRLFGKITFTSTKCPRRRCLHNRRSGNSHADKSNRCSNFCGRQTLHPIRLRSQYTRAWCYGKHVTGIIYETQAQGNCD